MEGSPPTPGPINLKRTSSAGMCVGLGGRYVSLKKGHRAMAEMRARAASPEALEPAPDRKRPRPVATPEVLRDTAMTCASSSSWLQAVPLRPLHERGLAEAAAPERAAGRAASADAPAACALAFADFWQRALRTPTV
ncbi:hypothetical protein QBZ16_001776 [Prototheca wickerhamii]|uniref:Uncharacterized protein n=1 Tax=Prototheca wickerhamii TaxID=3111 RepID=A0AAD9ID89_PROWI|nr:hypothetical protein QBZ16_001776 [Prototheca wickerhamii]